MVNYLDPFHRIVGVHWRTGNHRYFLEFAATLSQSWDGPPAPNADGATADISAATSPYFSMVPWIGYRSGFGNSNPAVLTKHPAGQSGIISEQPNPGHSAEENQNQVIYSISLATLNDDNFVQVLFDQFDDHLDVGPGHDHTFGWQVVNSSVHNLNLLDIGQSATFTASGPSDHFSVSIQRLRGDRDNYTDPQDWGGRGVFELDVGPFGVLLTDGGDYPIKVTRVGPDDFVFDGFDFDGPDMGAGWYTRNDPFPD